MRLLVRINTQTISWSSNPEQLCRTLLGGICKVYRNLYPDAPALSSHVCLRRYIKVAKFNNNGIYHAEVEADVPGSLKVGNVFEEDDIVFVCNSDDTASSYLHLLMDTEEARGGNNEITTQKRSFSSTSTPSGGTKRRLQNENSGDKGRSPRKVKDGDGKQDVGKLARRHVCSGCGKGFKRQNHLTMHRKMSKSKMCKDSSGSNAQSLGKIPVGLSLM